ncbi:helix-turn-helix transcriptional regulator, partial [Pseudokineococcus sp. 1T1Z-3]|uniref:helix-turn-helix transcriptional regulator n=1 Tax=Pseudokineococcus sp. 1T1Z-3 TaxID=3132745 RepID=UPI00309563EE
RPDVLGELALACRDGERVRFHYVAGDGGESERSVEPAALVASRRSWFLLAWDRGREDWRTFRVDRTSRLLRLGVRDPRREVPGGDPAAVVAEALRWRRSPATAEVVVDLPLAALQAHLGGWAGEARAEGDERCVWPVGGASAAQVLSALAWLPEGVSYEVRATPELLADVAAAARRVLAATGAGSGQGVPEG